MSNSKVVLVILILIVIAVGGFVIFSKNKTNTIEDNTDQSATTTITTTVNSTSTTGKTPISTSTQSSSVKSYTIADVSKHTVATDCWSAINNKVYDLTQWINKHPGGSKAILSICGKDGSAAFNGQHGGQKRPASELAGFDIGVLIK